MKKKKVLYLDKNENILKEYKDIWEAVDKTGLSKSTIYHQCHNFTNGYNGFHFRFKEVNNNSKAVVLLNKDNELIEEFNSQKEAAKFLGVHPQTVNNLLRGRNKNKKYTVVYKSDYKVDTEPQVEEQPRRKAKEYYVNVLVGLANGTLIDGATYEVNGTVLTYENNTLKLGEKEFYTQEQMWKEVSIELPILLPEEKNFLSNLLKAFTDVKGIIKCKDRRDGYEYIRIETSSEEESIALPSFLEGKYYQSLQINKLYSLEMLGLDGC